MLQNLQRTIGTAAIWSSMIALMSMSGTGCATDPVPGVPVPVETASDDDATGVTNDIEIDIDVNGGDDSADADADANVNTNDNGNTNGNGDDDNDNDNGDDDDDTGDLTLSGEAVCDNSGALPVLCSTNTLIISGADGDLLIELFEGIDDPADIGADDEPNGWWEIVGAGNPVTIEFGDTNTLHGEYGSPGVVRITKGTVVEYAWYE